MKKLATVILVLAFSSIVSGQAVDRGKFTRSGLWLQNAMLHDGQDSDASTGNNAVNPWVYLWSQGTGGNVTIRYYTSYISDGPGEHHQRIVIMNGKGTVVAEVTRGFRTEAIKNGKPPVFIAAIDEIMNIPPQDVSEPDRFGAWNIKIYADGVLMAEYPMPYVALPSDD